METFEDNLISKYFVLMFSSSVLRCIAQILEQTLCNTSQPLSWPWAFWAKAANERQRFVWDIIGAVGSAPAHQAPSPGAEPHRQSQLLVGVSFGSAMASNGPGVGLLRGSRSTRRQDWREGSNLCLRGLSGRQATDMTGLLTVTEKYRIAVTNFPLFA